MAEHRREPDAYLISTRHEFGRHYRRWYEQRIETIIAGGLGLGILVGVCVWAGMSSQPAPPDVPTLAPVYLFALPTTEVPTRVRPRPLALVDAFAGATVAYSASIRVDSIRTVRLVHRQPSPTRIIGDASSQDVRPDAPPTNAPAGTSQAPEVVRPAATASPTSAPAPTPTPVPSTTPELTPTVTPSPAPEPTIEPSPSPSPSLSEEPETVNPSPSVSFNG